MLLDAFERYGLALLTASVGVALGTGHVLPRGAQTAYQSNRTGDYDIYLLDVSRSITFDLTPYELNDIEPAWSPDSRSIALTFVQRRASMVAIIDVDTTDIHYVTRGYKPLWHP